jgi:uncharacterized membrane protein
MEKLIVIVFDEEIKAEAGLEALRALDRAGEISLFDVRSIAKDPNGSVLVLKNREGLDFPVTGVSTLVGTLVGILGGPAGVLGGAAAGALIGSIVKLAHAGVTDEFVNDIRTALAAGKFALVADVWEDWMTPLDTKMEALGGVIFRRTRSQVKNVHHNLDVAAHRAEMEQLKAERAQARGERLAKIDAKVDQLGKNLERALLRERSDILSREEQRDARIRALRSKADQSKEEIRGRLEARINDLQREYDRQNKDAA